MLKKFILSMTAFAVAMGMVIGFMELWFKYMVLRLCRYSRLARLETYE